MDLQWQLLLTNAIGFLVVLWILKKFAWGPLLSIMEERRNKISAEFASIEDEQGKVAALKSEYEAKLADIESERRAKIVEAVGEGKQVAEEIKATAREEAKGIAAKARDELSRDVAKAKVQLKEEMIAITLSATQKIINERLDDSKHRELIDNFIENASKV